MKIGSIKKNNIFKKRLCNGVFFMTFLYRFRPEKPVVKKCGGGMRSEN